MSLFDANISVYMIVSSLLFDMHTLLRWYFFAFGMNVKIPTLFYIGLYGDGINVVYWFTSSPGRANQTQGVPDSQGHWFSI